MTGEPTTARDDETACGEVLCTTALPHHTHSDAEGRSWCCGPYPYTARQNHFTRDIKTTGNCPACDAIRAVGSRRGRGAMTEHGGLAYLENLAAYSTNPTLLRAVAEVRAEIVESRPLAPAAVSDDAGEDDEARLWALGYQQVRRPTASPGGQAYELREALVEVLAPRLAIGGGTAAGRLADALLSGPLAPLLADGQAVQRVEDGAPRAEGAEERGQGVCRTCLAPIWNEGGTVRGAKRAEGWSDRIERGGDSLVCFKAIGYRHVPLTGREAAIYDGAVRRALDGDRG